MLSESDLPYPQHDTPRPNTKAPKPHDPKTSARIGPPMNRGWRSRTATVPYPVGFSQSLSGAEGIRTPNLRRAKSGPYYRGRSPLFKNTFKTTCLPLEAFVFVRRRWRALVYYWCNRCTATGRTVGSVLAAFRWSRLMVGVLLDTVSLTRFG